jgi:hypothetical protein
MDTFKIDEILYRDRYIKHCYEDYNFVWNIIKNDYDILNKAIEVKRDKFNENDTFTHLAIVELMLINYKDVPKDIYNRLVGLIYSNTDLARIVLNGAANGGYSFLLYTLFNFDLELTQEMKEFAQSEAMNKIGTTLWRKKRREYSSSLDEAGVSDDVTVNMNIDGMDMPIGAKSGCEYLHYMFSTLSDELAHGTGEYDIRYHILRNPNWSVEEKKKLVYEFFESQETYDEFLELWEWGIINDNVNYIDDCVPCLDKSDLYYYTFEDLCNIYGSIDTAKYIYDEIQFCKLMHQIRPQEWECEFVLKK